VWVTIFSTSHKKTHIGCDYFPGSTPTETLAKFTEKVISTVTAHPEDNFILVGDFNCPKFQTTCINPASKVNKLTEMMDLCNFQQLSNIKSDTTSNNLLDLVFSNRNLRVERWDDPLTKADAYHPPFVFEVDVNTRKNDAESKAFRNFKSPMA
jgi:hypothetical protein